MTGPSSNTGIAVATSIPPKLVRENAGRRVDGEYQRLCIQSWLACGFRVISVNADDEIATLAPCFPDVHFVETSRNASSWTGRKNPYISDLLSALKDAPEPVVGIVNSDLVFENSSAWRECLPSLAALDDAIVIGQRYDATSLLTGTFRRFWPGFDYFFFAKPLANILVKDAMPFAMGLPFWDYWLPAAAAINNRQILVVENPNVAHLMHAHGYNPRGLVAFTRFFAHFVIKSVEQSPGPMPECISAIVPTCRAILALREGVPNEEEEILKKTTEIMTLFLPIIRARGIRYEPSLSHGSDGNFQSGHAGGEKDLTASNVFSDFQQRLEAGEAFERAKGLVLQNRVAEAGAEFQVALRQARGDFEVLLSFGEFLFSHGNPSAALQLIAEVVEYQPESCNALNSLGVVLHGAGRREEAIETFKKLLRIEPKYKGAYTSLAIVLFEAKRQREALDYLRQALAIWPDFAEADKLHSHFSRV